MSQMWQILSKTSKNKRQQSSPKGKIVEQGSHLELLKGDGYYKTLYNMQFANKVA